MKSSKKSDLCFCGAPYKQKATNKNLELELAFVSIDDNELKQLGESQDPKQVKRSVPDIRSQLFEVYNLAVHGLDIKEFCGKNEEC
jgi:hypothetical protein